MEKLFERILDDDEKIVKILRPNKFKFYMSFFTKSTLCLIWFVLIGVFAILFPDDGMEVRSKALAIIPVAVYVAIEFVIMMYAVFYYKTLYYAVTNKRLIIRSGVFGVDYRSLDMGMIGAIDVYVSLLDKLLRKDTGAVCFGSTASPMVATYGGSFYRFNHIEKPYESCKEIKVSIDAFKNKAKDNSSAGSINNEPAKVETNNLVSKEEDNREVAQSNSETIVAAEATTENTTQENTEKTE